MAENTVTPFSIPQVPGQVPSDQPCNPFEPHPEWYPGAPVPYPAPGTYFAPFDPPDSRAILIQRDLELDEKVSERLLAFALTLGWTPSELVTWLLDDLTPKLRALLPDKK